MTKLTGWPSASAWCHEDQYGGSGHVQRQTV
jgi:hypothetical protein